MTVSILRPVTWGLNSNSPPLDVPVCGFIGELCVPLPTASNTTWVITGAVVAGVVLALLVLTLQIVKSRRAEAKIRQMIWKVNFMDIVAVNHGAALSSTANFRSTTSLSGVGSSRLSTNLAVYKGVTISVMRVEKHEVELTRQDFIELVNLKETSHDNIRAFHGACIEPGNVCYLMQFCSRRTLQDIIEDDSLKLDMVFRISLLTDIANGMSYLHKSVFQSHGHLTSAECHVDSRWVLKIGGFGLHAFRDTIDCNEVGEYAYYRDQLWTAPELLRMKHRPVNGTQKSDVYSFAIIVQEMVYRAQPYFCDRIAPRVILERICAEEYPPYRPVMNFLDGEINPTFESIMRQCWTEESASRPTFDGVAKTIRNLNNGKKVDIVDTMLQKLEKYADNLEGLVQQRTAELEDEKQKTDLLLYRMLPPFVADELKAGRNVKPRMYDFATIYFSDIVGFTTLSSKSTPFEVVDLLNDLYNTFDDTIAKFDVYKVETIGDAYMVVSGLPKPNEGRHIVEICNMALDLLDEVSRFKIRHRPDEKLRLRIGIHTGPCASGVVGHAMPRYCLFGDTVNTASRMESTGEALRIHLSADAQAAIASYAGYITEPRGETQVKGKGVLNTHWLCGKLDIPTV